MIRCPNCNISPATLDALYGVLPCPRCHAHQKTLQKPTVLPVEFINRAIKEQRTAYLNDFLPMHNRGELSKEWVEKYGEKKALQHGFSKKEIKKARNVWNSEKYYKEV